MFPTSKDQKDPLLTLASFIDQNNFTELQACLRESPFRHRTFDFSAAHLTARVGRIEARYQDQRKPYKFILPRNNLTLLHLCALFDALECFILPSTSISTQEDSPDQVR
jgi:hypothetical protein